MSKIRSVLNSYLIREKRTRGDIYRPSVGESARLRSRIINQRNNFAALLATGDVTKCPFLAGHVYYIRRKDSVCSDFISRSDPIL